MTTTSTALRIVELRAENLKRLKAIEIKPDPNGGLVVIAGKNGQGKTSVLDAILFALAGTAAQKGTPRPIRDGADHAEVVLDLGDLIVTRKWTTAGQTLTVTAADGAKYSSPQRMLGDLIGKLSFDPLAFSQLSEKDQRRQLLALVELPFDVDALDRERLAVFDERTEINRDAKHLAAQIDGLERPRDGLPTEPVEAAEVHPEELSVTAALDAYRAGQEHNRRYFTEMADHESALARVNRAREALAAARQLLTQAEEALAASPKPVDDDLPDLDALRAAVDEVEQVNQQRRTKADEINRRAREEAAETNRQIAHAAEYARQHQILTDTEDAADNLTERLADIDQDKADALANAKMPIPGLGFDDTGVTYQGVPFSQCSAAERLRVSLAMAMALNPKLRVIRITDGSLLDSDNMRLIEEMASARGFQCWVERVDESGTVGVVIEDGEVRP